MSSRLMSGLVLSAALALTAATVPGAVALLPAAAAAVAPDAPAAALEQSQTVSADALPTVQIDGVAWKQVVVGDTVIVGGEFTTARPAGAAPGVDTTPRSNMLAYDIRTGELVPGFAPSFNGKVSDMAVTPDGSKLVVVGAFTAVNDVSRYRVAVLNLPSGTLAAAAPSLDAPAQSVAVTDTTAYIGGYFSRAGSTARSRVAAFDLASSTVLPFTIPVDDGQVQSMVLNPDASQLVISGNFTSVGGSNNPGYGLYRADAATGAGLPLPVNSRIRNAGANSAILRVASAGDSFYGGGYNFGKTGTTEGMFRASWSDGSLINMEDCHGDTYDIAPIGDVVYNASHKHYCGNSGGFPQTTPWSYYHSTAWTKATRGSNLSDIYGYPAHPGTPRPDLLTWFPKTDVGTYTGKSQAVWTVAGDSRYVVYGGEFPKVNGTAQQGLVRYAVRSLAPNKQGPRPTGSTWTPTVQSLRSGEVRVTWPAMWDRDDATLTYRVSRETVSNVVHEEQQTSQFWNGRTMSFTDRGLAPGTTRYVVRVTDASGNLFSSGWINVTVSSGDLVSDYTDLVLDDGASKFWPLDEPAGSAAVADLAGADATTAGSGVTRGVAGPVAGATASSFNATVGALVAGTEFRDAPDTFSQEVWFKTSSTTGGKISGYGTSRTGDSGSYDRHLYMDTAGRVVFGVYSGANQALSSATGYNNGQWHHAVATLGANGMQLFLDGKRVGARADVTSGARYPGYWRVGGDKTWSGGKYFNGQIADFAVYPAVLSPQQVNAHLVASGRPSALPTRPLDTLGRAVFDSGPELFWRLNDSAVTATDSALGANPGTYAGNYTQRQTGVRADDTSVLLRAPSRTFFSTTPAGTVTQASPTTAPSRFSQEVWVKTSSTTGGRILGFGNGAGTTSSTAYDRMLWMTDAGKVRFGVDSGSRVVVESARALNDGAWHQLVATLDPAEGMKLYVDGRLESTDPNGTAKSYAGYWRVGADGTWGGASQSHFLGQVDEAAVWSRTLSANEVGTHFTAGGGVLPNVAPTAAFTATASDLSVSLDASASADPDGSVASYTWDFGDGTPAASGVTASRTYTAPGAYTVRLTVTDDRGGTATTTRQVRVVRPNAAPTAAFTATTDGLGVAVDGSGSSDPDGSVASYSWSWGDGSPADSGPTATHTYASAGERTITLTVTDDKGATTSTTRQVSVSRVNAEPTAAFTVSASNLSVSADASGSTDADGSVASYSWDWGDGSAADSGRTATHTYATAGQKSITVTVTDDDGATSSATRQVSVAAPASNVLASDGFDRTVAGGWGTAETGGAWSTTGSASRFSVGDSAGTMSLVGGQGLNADLNGLSSADSVVTAEFTVDKLAEGQYVGLRGRKVGSNAYDTRLRVAADGSVRMWLLRNGSTVVGSVYNVPFTVTPGTTYTLKMSVTGTSPTTLSAKVWPSAEQEPTAWQRTATDGTADLQVAGAPGVFAWLPSSAAAVAPVRTTFLTFSATTSR